MFIKFFKQHKDVLHYKMQIRFVSKLLMKIDFKSKPEEFKFNISRKRFLKKFPLKNSSDSVHRVTGH